MKEKPEPGDEVESLLRHKFAQRELLTRALTHRSLAYEQRLAEPEAPTPNDPSSDNEQLEFLGDAVVGFLVAEDLCRRYPELHEGALTRLRAELVSRKHLGQVAARLNLGAYMLLGRGEERSGGRKKTALLANCIEAVMAALYLDGGVKTARSFVLREIIEPCAPALREQLHDGSSIGDYKSALSGVASGPQSQPARVRHQSREWTRPPQALPHRSLRPRSRRPWQVPRARHRQHQKKSRAGSRPPRHRQNPLRFSARSSTRLRAQEPGMTQPAEVTPSGGQAAAPAPVLPTPVPPAVHQRAAIHIVYPSLLETISSLLSILVVAMFLLTFLVQPFRIPSESMERTLLVGDFLLVNKSIYGPPGHFSWLLPYRPVQDGDIVVFHFPLNPPEHVVKRVIGAPGDRIHLKNGIVYRNGQPLNEPYPSTNRPTPTASAITSPPKPYTDPDVDIHWWQQMRRKKRKRRRPSCSSRRVFRHGRQSQPQPRQPLLGLRAPFRHCGPPFHHLFLAAADAFPNCRGTHLTPQDDKLDHERDPLDKIVDFARWNRILRIVR